ncbi:MAG: hypothetical protein ACKVP0_06670 [Pirellulaceae bacterium]
MSWENLESLIMVAGHSIFTAEDFDAPEADSSWVLEPFQKGEPPYYMQHIREGVRLASNDPTALLVFSGGQTRAKAGPKSESLSYWQIARHFSWYGYDVESRATTEEYARDSFENVLFSICRFWECVGSMPKEVKIVSWAFKEERFTLHSSAIRFPAQYFGVNNPAAGALELAERGEEKTRRSFHNDPYGSGPELGAKRMARNPFRRNHPYLESCKPLAGLLRHIGPQNYEGELPWKAG